MMAGKFKRGSMVQKHIAKAPPERRTLDGVVFDSIDEMKWHAGLQLRERAGQIRNLRRQVPFHLQVYVREWKNGVPFHRPIDLRRPWKADAVYEELIDGKWRRVVADRKAVDTRESNLVRRMVEKIHNITIRTS